MEGLYLGLWLWSLLQLCLSSCPFQFKLSSVSDCVCQHAMRAAAFHSITAQLTPLKFQVSIFLIAFLVPVMFKLPYFQSFITQELLLLAVFLT